MQILIGCAKTMTRAAVPTGLDCTVPVFSKQAQEIALQMADYSAEDLEAMLRINPALAAENRLRYLHFGDQSALRPAAFAYDGMVFRKLAPETMSESALAYANDHLNIGSFLYGLLRPLDLISPYRLEGDVRLPGLGDETLFDFWKPLLTDYLIEKTKADDGILVNLASNEFRDIFTWKQVCKELTVVTPEFRVDKGGKLRTVVIYAKMCRGAMTHYIIERRAKTLDELREFEYEGFRWVNDWNFNL